MKVCIFNGDMSRGGGTERMTAILANVLIEKNYDVYVLSCGNSSGTSYFPLDKNIKHVWLKKPSVIGKIFELRKFIKREKIDVIINVDVMLGIFSLPACFLRKTKVIAWEMFNIRNDIGSKHTKTIRKLSLKKCAYFVNQTEGDSEAFKREFNAKCPITYVYNPIDKNEGYTDYDKNSKTLITAGHFFYTKGYDLALEVAKKVFAVHPDWNWRFVGDGSHFEELKLRAKEYGLENNVIFAGRTKNIDEEYKRASIYVMTSRTEGFGLVLTEAKSYNLPTLAFDVPFGPKEIIDHGKSGYLVSAFDIDKMAEKVCRLIEDEDLRIEFSNHAKDNLDKFSLDAFANRWIEILESVKKN